MVARTATELRDNLSAFTLVYTHNRIAIRPVGDEKVATIGEFARRRFHVVDDLPEGTWIPVGNTEAFLRRLFQDGTPLYFQQLDVSWST